MKIRIISGAYGQRLGRRIVVKTAKDAPFDIDAAEGRRLASLGIAEIIDAGTVATPPTAKSKTTARVAPPKRKSPAKGKKTAVSVTHLKELPDKPPVLSAVDPE